MARERDFANDGARGGVEDVEIVIGRGGHCLPVDVVVDGGGGEHGHGIYYYYY